MVRTTAYSLAGVLTLALSAGVGQAADMISPQLDKAGFELIVTMTVKPGNRDKVIEIMKPHVAASRKEPGVVLFEFYGGTTDCSAGKALGLPDAACDPLTFYILELYKDRAAFEAHVKEPRLAKVIEALNSLSTKNAEVKIVNPLP